MAQQGSAGNVIAALSSFFIPGLGQLIQGRILAAIVHFVVRAVLFITPFGWAFHLWSAISAAIYTTQSSVPDTSPTAKEKISSEKIKQMIPDGYTFGDHVLMLPPIDNVFEGPLMLLHGSYSGPRPRIGYGRWVERGEILCVFGFRKGGSFFDRFFDRDYVAVPVKSPVSGVMLNESIEYNKPVAILLPNGELPPEPTEYVFGDLCDFCWEHREYIFQKPKELHGYPAYTDEGLRERFKKQRTGNYETVSARERYFWVIQSLRKRDTDLRHLLAHISEPAMS